MTLNEIKDDSSYCVAVSERGVGCWTYLTFTGLQLKSGWSSMTGFYRGISAPSNIGRWSPLNLPDDTVMLVREHLGVVTKDVMIAAELARMSAVPHGKTNVTKRVAPAKPTKPVERVPVVDSVSEDPDPDWFGSVSREIVDLVMSG